MKYVRALLLALSLFAPMGLGAQPNPIASPAGESATEVAGSYSAREGYEGGKWIQIHYGRPIKRQRNLFDLPDWREALLDGAPVWRAGANVSTRLTTQIDLYFAGTKVPAGEYTVFIDFGQSEATKKPWTFIISSWPAQPNYDYENKEALWGAYDYTDDRDIVRAQMIVEVSNRSFDQLSWHFTDVDSENGALTLLWDSIQATVPFSFHP